MTRTTVPLTGATELLTVDPATGRLRSREYRVTVLSGPDAGKSRPLTAPLAVGTASEAGFCLTDSSVSRLHVQLKPRSDGVAVSDLGSLNGTFVSGARIEQALVGSEATLSIGQTLLRISTQEAELEVPLGPTRFGDAVAESPAMRRVFGLLEKLANSDVPVVLAGETGTGKDVLARALHRASPRAGRPLVVLDCSSVAPTLIESELFGHARGAFTGASSERNGAFLQADGGTLFLDEIGELPLELQPRLLRALEAGQVKRVGEDAWRPVDGRVIAATHRDLAAAVKAGTFRADLYYRLAVALVQVPPLRERVEDLPMLIARFLKELGKEGHVLPVGLLAKMSAYPWPGNVRELRNVVARALLGDVNALDGAGSSIVSRPEVSLEVPYKEAKERLLEGFTRDYLEALLYRHAGNVSRAARVAGIARPHLHKLVARYGLKAADDEPAEGG